MHPYLILQILMNLYRLYLIVKHCWLNIRQEKVQITSFLKANLLKREVTQFWMYVFYLSAKFSAWVSVIYFLFHLFLVYMADFNCKSVQNWAIVFLGHVIFSVNVSLIWNTYLSRSDSLKSCGKMSVIMSAWQHQRKCQTETNAVKTCTCVCVYYHTDTFNLKLSS